MVAVKSISPHEDNFGAEIIRNSGARLFYVFLIL